MIRTAFLALALAAVLCARVDAQTADALSLVHLDGTSSALYAEDRSEAGTPASVVAMRVRSVLNDHENPAAWRELSGALPELAIAGGADLESTFDAARIAGEIGRDAAPGGPAAETPATDAVSQAGRVVPGAEVVADVLGELGRDTADVVAGIGTPDLQLIAKALAVLVVLYALVKLLFGGGGRTSPATARKSGGSTAGRHREARSLYAEGVPVHEIARRTGLARDAVAVLVSRGAR